MSGSDDDGNGGGAGRREVAYRLFAAEYEDADFSYSESDEERAPNYVVTPSGARVNRLFVVGVLTELEQVNEDVLRARIVDPTGAFVVYAGQYQPDALAFLERADPPTFVALTGKARTFQPDDADTVYTSVRPESINEVDAETRDRWVVGTAERTLHRVATMADALGREERGDDLAAALTAGGVEEGLAAGVAMALEHYGTTPTYLGALRDTALDAARVVAGDREEVEGLSVAPDADGATTLADLAGLDSPVGEIETGGATEAADSQSAATETATTHGTTADSSATGEAGDDAVTADSDDTTAEPEPADTTTAGPESVGTPTSEPGAAETADSSAATSETAGSEPADESSADDDIGDFEGGEFEIEDDERERIEEEYGTDFSTGTEVDDPGEADIETPDPEEIEADESTAQSDAEQTEADAEPDETAVEDVEPETSSADESEPDLEAADEPTDVDLIDAVMAAMRELDDGDGADHDDVVASVVEEYGTDPQAVEEAVQDALMDGRCYEPGDETLKPI